MRLSHALIYMMATLHGVAHADRFLLDSQGNSPDRVAIFSTDFSTASTPVGPALFGPTFQQTIEVTMVYEAPSQPYWTEMDLELNCPNPNHKKHMAKKRKKGQPAEWVLTEVDTVEFRMLRGEKRLKTKIEREALQPTDWQQSDSYLMKQIYRVACNSDAIYNAKRSSSSADGKTIDMAVLRQKLRALGLNTAEYVPPGTFGDFLGEFAWTNLWPNTPKPEINNGRPLTMAEQAELKQKLEAARADIEAHRVKVQGRLDEMKADFDFTAAAAKFRGNRKWSNTETAMNQVWQAKTEADVVAAIGPPVVQDAGGVRFLSYGQDYDNRYIVRRVVSGEEWVEGVYTSCNLRFVLIPDSKNVLRVADVVVSAYSSNGTGRTTSICSGLLDVPH